jgi:hypothetical protein
VAWWLAAVAVAAQAVAVAVASQAVRVAAASQAARVAVALPATAVAVCSARAASSVSWARMLLRYRSTAPRSTVCWSIVEVTAGGTGPPDAGVAVESQETASRTSTTRAIPSQKSLFPPR